jgi:hypothetical protein
MALPTWAIAIDWNNDGVFTGTGEDVSSRVLLNPTPSFVRGLDQVRPLAPPMVGVAAFSLNNQSLDYSPFNTASPIYGTANPGEYGNLVPGRAVRCQATFNAVTYDVWQGILDDLQNLPGLFSYVNITALGTLARLTRQQRLSSAVYLGILTSDAINIVLDAVGWPSDKRVISTGKTMLTWWWLDNEDAFQALVTLVATEGPGAALYEDNQGRIVFEHREYRELTTRSNTAQATLRDQGTEPLYSVPLSYLPGYRHIVNEATVVVRRRSVKAETTVWSLGTTLTLGPNETRTVVAYSSDPVVQAVIPTEAGGDFTVTAGSILDTLMDRDSGTRITLSLVAGSNGATVTGLRLRARPVTIDQQTQVTSLAGTQTTRSAALETSRSRYGIRPWQANIWGEVSLDTARGLVNSVVARYREPRPFFNLTLYGSNDSRIAQCLNREISDRVQVIESKTSLNHGAWINRIEHKLLPTGLVQTNWELELADKTLYWVLDRSQLDSDTILGYTGLDDPLAGSWTLDSSLLGTETILG